MKKISIILMLIIFCLGELCVNLTNAQAQRGERGHITKADLKKLLSNSKGSGVSGYKIKGDDIIALLQDDSLPHGIKIQNSIILGELDFTKLPKVNLTGNLLPEDWNEYMKERWLKHRGDNRENHIVKHKIQITKSTIQPRPSNDKKDENSVVLHASNTFFFKEVIFGGEVSLGEGEGTIFKGIIYLKDSTFGDKADFSFIEFDKESIFARVFFAMYSSFKNSLFTKKANFINSIFFRHAIFEGAIIRSIADFSRSEFRTGSNFIKTSFEGGADFSSARLGVSAASGNKKADNFFINVNFKNNTDFCGPAAQSPDDGVPENHFNNATFKTNTDFYSTKFLYKVHFNQATFQKVDFSESTFERPSDFSEVSFTEKVKFYNATFKKEANFDEAIFRESVYFTNSKFLENLALKDADFNKEALFQDSKIAGICFKNLKNLKELGGKVDFSNAVISRALFENLSFSKEVDFSNVVFGGSTSDRPNTTDKEPLQSCGKYSVNLPQTATVFRKVLFREKIHFLNASFCGFTAFHHVEFRSGANFTQSLFITPETKQGKTLLFSHISFSNIQINWRQLPDIKFWYGSEGFVPLKDKTNQEFLGNMLTFRKIKILKNEQSQESVGKTFILRGEIDGDTFEPETVTLKFEPLSNVLNKFEIFFRETGDLESANTSFYNMKVTQLQEIRTQTNEWLGAGKSPSGSMLVLERISAEVSWLFWGLTSGYGTKLGRLVVFVLILNILFALVYLSSNFRRLAESESRADFKFSLRLLDFPKEYIDDRRIVPRVGTVGKKSKIFEALRFSSVLLFKCGHRDTVVSGRVGIFNVKNFVRIEWLLGYFVIGAISITLGNTQPFLNKLLEAVF